MDDHEQVPRHMESDWYPEQARQDAFEEAVEGTPRRRESDFVSKALKKKKGACEPARKEIRRARKDRLRTVEHFLCDACDNEIKSEKEGYVIHGNIYVADPNSVGGLIGDNFPDDDEPVTKDRVTRTVMCRQCFMRALGLFKPNAYKDDNKRVEAYNVNGRIEAVPRRAIH